MRVWRCCSKLVLKFLLKENWLSMACFMLQCFATLAGFCQHRQKQRVLAARLGCPIFDNYVAFDGNIDANCKTASALLVKVGARSQVLFGVVYEGRVRCSAIHEVFWPFVRKHKWLFQMWPKCSPKRATYAPQPQALNALR
jgi:hypothetical protein